MVSFFSQVAGGAVVVFTIAFGFAPAYAAPRELATAQGRIAISEPRPGLRAPSCSELVVEARDALDNRLIAETRPTTDEAGACHYALSVPAQMAVWLHLQPALVAEASVVGPNIDVPARSDARARSGSVALRFTIISPTTYFFAPNERKTLQLTY